MNTKLKCLLLDDEIPGLTYLKMLCEQLPELDVVKAFNSPEAFLKELPNLEFDLCILDIEMPEMNGLQIANLLNGKPVIFATAYKDYAAEAFDLNAIDYIRKPIKLDRLKQAVQKAMQYIAGTLPSNEKPFLQLNTDRGKSIIFIDQLYYFKTSEIDSRDKLAYLLNGSTVLLKNITFEKLMEMLPDQYYCRVNKRELIALRAVQVFSFDEIKTNIKDENGKLISVTLSETYRQEFLKRVNF
ncbi:MAG: response regulator transcription factor [Cyclobacteriaceae bacterium]|nr:response regulator transcription factor [Cyclobacteriaceae bacterium]